MKFTRDYTEYWQKTVDKSVDGLKIAGPNEAAQIIKTFSLMKTTTVVDVGCSYGRMFNIVKDLGTETIGLDPDPFAAKKASKLGYSRVLVGTAEKTRLDNESVDVVFCWASFDVVNQFESLLEFNRILKKGGRVLVTGKNWNYFQDDLLGLLAEKKAFIKNFPNHFTDLDTLIQILPGIGFKLNGLLLFPKRGDMGEVKFSRWQPSRLEVEKSYEYLIYLEKTDSKADCESIPQFSFRYSKTAETVANRLGIKSVEEYLLGGD